MPAPSELEGLLKYHERREERVYRAWFCAHQPTHISAWLQLGMHKLNDVDSKEFDEFVVADVAKHGNPEGVEQFVSHYNRLIDQRAAFFRRTYRIKQLLGMGGFSRVVSANRLIDGQVFALKISAKSFAEKRALELMDDELRIWAKDELVHPGLVRLCGFYELPEATVLVSELCMGGCLLDALEEVESMDESSVRKIGAQVVSAILHLHEVARVIHRDIKPENVLCTHPNPHLEGRVLLSDFGLAAEFNSSTLARLVGTPEYLAPELVDMLQKARSTASVETPMPRRHYDERIDTWALGVLLYELFTGFPPFNDQDEDRLFEKIVGDNGATLDFPDVPFAVCSSGCIRLLLGLLDRNVEKRLAGNVLRQEANAWLNSDLPPTNPFTARPSFAHQTAQFRRRKLKAMALATTACVRFVIEGRNSAANAIQNHFRTHRSIRRANSGKGSIQKEGNGVLVALEVIET